MKKKILARFDQLTCGDVWIADCKDDVGFRWYYEILRVIECSGRAFAIALKLAPPGEVEEIKGDNEDLRGQYPWPVPFDLATGRQVGPEDDGGDGVHVLRRRSTDGFWTKGKRVYC